MERRNADWAPYVALFGPSTVLIGVLVALAIVHSRGITHPMMGIGGSGPVFEDTLLASPPPMIRNAFPASWKGPSEKPLPAGDGSHKFGPGTIIAESGGQPIFYIARSGATSAAVCGPENGITHPMVIITEYPNANRFVWVLSGQQLDMARIRHTAPWETWMDGVIFRYVDGDQTEVALYVRTKAIDGNSTTTPSIGVDVPSGDINC